MQTGIFISSIEQMREAREQKGLDKKYARGRIS
jgi:hypothetical protein